jgi:drug/metabolite transporter (DMT)-like permease
MILVAAGIVAAAVGGLAKIYARNRFDSGIFFLAGVLVVFGLLFYFRRQFDTAPSPVGKWLGWLLIVAGICMLVLACLLPGGPAREDAMLIAFGFVLYGLAIVWQGKRLF